MNVLLNSHFLSLWQFVELISTKLANFFSQERIQGIIHVRPSVFRVSREKFLELDLNTPMPQILKIVDVVAFILSLIAKVL